MYHQIIVFEKHYVVGYYIHILDMRLLSFRKFTSLIQTHKISCLGNPVSNVGTLFPTTYPSLLLRYNVA